MAREYEKQLVIDTARAFGIDATIAYFQIEAESAFNPRAVSSAGAKGIAQFMPATAAGYGLSDRFDPVASMNAWGRYMTDLLNRFNGDYAASLAGYNWGEGRVDTARNRYGSNWLSHAPTETQNYVAKILSRAAQAAPAGVAPIYQIPDEDPFGTGPLDVGMVAVVSALLAALVLMVR
jgi:soluble lytic murein transglycosylase-like protein